MIAFNDPGMILKNELAECGAGSVDLESADDHFGKSIPDSFSVFHLVVSKTRQWHRPSRTRFLILINPQLIFHLFDCGVEV